MNTKTMNEKEAKEFICECLRAEAYENPRVFSKAVRVTLLALGYNSEWVENTFRDTLDETIKSSNKEGENVYF